MYTVILRVDKLQRTTNERGTTGLKVIGQDYKESGPEKWEKFLVDRYNADFIAELERNGVGAVVAVGMEKKQGERWWNIVSIKPANAEQKATVDAAGGGAAQPDAPAGTTPAYQAPAPAPAPAQIVPMPTSEYSEKAFAVGKAVTMIDGMLKAGVIKGTKATPEIIFEGMISLADKLMEYMNEEVDSEPESDASDLEDAPVIPDDDIPF